MIPLIDLGAQYRELKAEIDAAIARVFESSQFILGTETEAFEEEFAAYCGVGYAIGVNSGTSALHLALLAAGIGPGDEVITVPFTFYATVATIGYVGATPVYVDIDLRQRSTSTSGKSKPRSPSVRALFCWCISTASPPTWIRFWISHAVTNWW